MPSIGTDWTAKEEEEYTTWLKKIGITGDGLDANIHSIFYNIVADITKARECTEKCLGLTEEQLSGIVDLMESGATFETAYKSIIV